MQHPSHNWHSCVSVCGVRMNDRLRVSSIQLHIGHSHVIYFKYFSSVSWPTLVTNISIFLCTRHCMRHCPPPHMCCGQISWKTKFNYSNSGRHRSEAELSCAVLSWSETTETILTSNVEPVRPFLLNFRCRLKLNWMRFMFLIKWFGEVQPNISIEHTNAYCTLYM